MHDARSAQRAGVATAIILAGAVAAVSYHQAAKLDYDFHHFYRDARFVWEHGALNPDLDNADPLERRQLPFYLPVVALLLAPITAGGITIAAAIWSALHAGALLISLRALHSWLALRMTGGVSPLAVACLASLPAIYETARFSQISFIVLALVLSGFAALQRGRRIMCGTLIGLATVLKLLPGVLLVWLLLKRQWTALWVAAISIALIAFVPCLAVFGPSRTLAYHQQWAAANLGINTPGGVGRASVREHFVDHRNQSVAAVTERLSWPGHPAKAPWQPLRISRTAGVRIAAAIMAALALGLMLMSRRPLTSMTRGARQAEFAAYLTAMLIFSPLLRQYYLVWCLPGLVVFAELGAGASSQRRRIAGRLGLVIWLAGMVAWLSPTARTYGAHLWMLVCIAILLVAAARGDDPGHGSCNDVDIGQNRRASATSTVTGDA